MTILQMVEDIDPFKGIRVRNTKWNFSSFRDVTYEAKNVRQEKESTSSREDTSCSDRCHVNLIPVLWILPPWVLFCCHKSGYGRGMEGLGLRDDVMRFLFFAL